MSPQSVNQITAIIAIILIGIVMLLVATGTIPALVAILLTVAIGAGVRFLRATLGKS